MPPRRRLVETFNHLMFSQRYGYESLPQPMQLEKLSDDLRREIWNATLCFFTIDRSGNDPSMGMLGAVEDGKTPVIIRDVLGEFLRLPHDEIDNRVPFNERHINYRQTKERILRGAFNRVLDLIEIVANLPDKPKGTTKFIDIIQRQFERHAAAYWLDTSSHPFRFYPRTSKEQGEATQQAIETIRESSMDGAATHLRQAAEHINARQYADSVADSIHAVESVARVISPKASKTLDPALDSLQGAGILKHPALVEAFKKLYGYTSDEQGIRHALLDKDSSDVDLHEAVFMFGACASFAAYLVDKQRQMKQQQHEDQ